MEQPADFYQALCFPLRCMVQWQAWTNNIPIMTGHGWPSSSMPGGVAACQSPTAWSSLMYPWRKRMAAILVTELMIFGVLYIISLSSMFFWVLSNVDFELQGNLGRSLWQVWGMGATSSWQYSLKPIPPPASHLPWFDGNQYVFKRNTSFETRIAVLLLVP